MSPKGLPGEEKSEIGESGNYYQEKIAGLTIVEPHITTLTCEKSKRNCPKVEK